MDYASSQTEQVRLWITFSTTYDLFPTDQAALDEGLRTIREEGIESLVELSND